jgi:hypothetical protein
VLTLPDDVDTPPVDVDTPPVEVDTPPVDVDTPPDVELVELTPLLVEEMTTLPPLLPPPLPPKKPPKKPLEPPPKPPPPPITTGGEPLPPEYPRSIIGAGAGGIGAGWPATLTTVGAQDVVVVRMMRRFTTRGA